MPEIPDDTLAAVAHEEPGKPEITTDEHAPLPASLGRKEIVSLDGHHRRATADGVVLVLHAGDKRTEILQRVAKIQSTARCHCGKSELYHSACARFCSASLKNHQIGLNFNQSETFARPLMAALRSSELKVTTSVATRFLRILDSPEPSNSA